VRVCVREYNRNPFLNNNIRFRPEAGRNDVSVEICSDAMGVILCTARLYNINNILYIVYGIIRDFAALQHYGVRELKAYISDVRYILLRYTPQCPPRSCTRRGYRAALQ